MKRLLLIMAALVFISAVCAETVDCKNGCSVCVPYCESIQGGIPGYEQYAIKCGPSIYGFWDSTGAYGQCGLFFNGEEDQYTNQMDIAFQYGSGDEFCGSWVEYMNYLLTIAPTTDCNSNEAIVVTQYNCPFGYVELQSCLSQGDSNRGVFSHTCDFTVPFGVPPSYNGNCYVTTGRSEDASNTYYGIQQAFQGQDEGCFMCKNPSGYWEEYYFGRDDFGQLICQSNTNTLSDGVSGCDGNCAVLCYSLAYGNTCY